jgi:hypothetical protein
MVQRCTNPNYQGFERYGGRGIEVTPAWRDFERFLADMGERPEGTTLDRINADGDYEPDNCRWADSSEQFGHERRKTHCVNGHPFAPENTWINAKGHRGCKTCSRERKQRRRAAGRRD